MSDRTPQVKLINAILDFAYTFQRLGLEVPVVSIELDAFFKLHATIQYGLNEQVILDHTFDMFQPSFNLGPMKFVCSNWTPYMAGRYCQSRYLPSRDAEQLVLYYNFVNNKKDHITQKLGQQKQDKTNE